MNLLKVFDVLPSPWNARFTHAAAVLTVIGIILITVKHGAVSWWPGVAACAAALLVLIGFRRIGGDTSEQEVRSEDRRRNYRFVWFSGGLLVSLGGLLLRGNASPVEWLLVAVPFFLAALLGALLSKHRTAAAWLFPLLLSLSVLGVSALMGNVAAGAFPAIFALVLLIILQATRDLELRVTHSSMEDMAAHKLVHRRLNWISVIFFVFGVISLWPWLGKLYGLTYLWILIIGVLFPIMTLWGRLRQPRRENMLTALVRFNCVAPYASLILLLALVLG